jgi:excinuclease UvrABC ATPase subunit
LRLRVSAHQNFAQTDRIFHLCKQLRVKEEVIEVRGARTHNLKNISFSLPVNKLTVVTGVSGSGKSSLAFDTIYAEGQRRYVESLSAYARQFLERMDKPDVDEIIGIAPAIAIRQKNSTRNPRSTVATQTEIYDYLRLLFARVGQTFCHVCGREVKKDSPESAATKFWKRSPKARDFTFCFRPKRESEKKKSKAQNKIHGAFLSLMQQVSRAFFAAAKRSNCKSRKITLSTILKTFSFSLTV